MLTIASAIYLKNTIFCGKAKTPPIQRVSLRKLLNFNGGDFEVFEGEDNFAVADFKLAYFVFKHIAEVGFLEVEADLKLYCFSAIEGVEKSGDYTAAVVSLFEGINGDIFAVAGDCGIAVNKGTVGIIDGFRYHRIVEAISFLLHHSLTEVAAMGQERIGELVVASICLGVGIGAAFKNG